MLLHLSRNFAFKNQPFMNLFFFFPNLLLDSKIKIIWDKQK